MTLKGKNDPKVLTLRSRNSGNFRSSGKLKKAKVHIFLISTKVVWQKLSSDGQGDKSTTQQEQEQEQEQEQQLEALLDSGVHCR